MKPSFATKIFTFLILGMIYMGIGVIGTTLLCKTELHKLQDGSVEIHIKQ